MVKCYACGEVGHLSRQCEKSRGNPPEEGVCYLCQRRGHWARVCPNRGQRGEAFSQEDRRVRNNEREVGTTSASCNWENRDRDMGNRPLIKKVSWAGGQPLREYKGDNNGYRNRREVDRQFERQREGNRRQDVTDYRRQRGEGGRFSEEERRYRYNFSRPEGGPRSDNGDTNGRFYSNRESSLGRRNSGDMPKHGRSETNRMLSVEEKSTTKGTADMDLLNREKLPKKITMLGLTDLQAFSKGEVDQKINKDKEPIINQPNQVVVTAQVHHNKDDVQERGKWVSSEEDSRDPDEIKEVPCDGDLRKHGGQENNSKKTEEKGWVQKEIDEIWQSVKTFEQTLESMVDSKYVQSEESLVQGKRESSKIEFAKAEENLLQKVDTQVQTELVAHVVNQEEVPIRVLKEATQEVKVQKGQELGTALRDEEEPEGRKIEKIIRKTDATNGKYMEDGYDLTHWNKANKCGRYDSCRQYDDLFLKDDDNLSGTQVKRKVSPGQGVRLIYRTPYGISHKQREILNGETKRPKKKEIIRPSWRPPDRLTYGSSKGVRRYRY